MSQEPSWIRRLLSGETDVDLASALRCAREQARTALETLREVEQQAADRLDTIDRLKDEQRRTTVRVAELVEEKNQLAQKADERAQAIRHAEDTLTTERGRLMEALSRVEVLTKELEAAQRGREADAEKLGALEKQRLQQLTALRYERRRWRALVSLFWQALELALGDTALLAVTRVLEREADLSEGLRVGTPAAAAAALTKQLRTRALGGEVNVEEVDGGMDLLVQWAEPLLPDEPVPRWVAPLVAHLLGRMLGVRLQADRAEQADAALRIRARFRDRGFGRAGSSVRPASRSHPPLPKP